MKISSAKAKGRRCAVAVKQLLLSNARLRDDDVHVTSSSVPGRDLTLSPVAQEVYPFAIECKNVEKLNVRIAFDQAVGHAKPGEIPVLFHSRNRDVMLVTLRAEEFLRLLNRHADDFPREEIRSDQTVDRGISEAGEKEGN